jgi:hypothetical protein
MTSTARRVLRATAAVTGMAALGTGIAGAAFAEEAHVQRGEGFQMASIDGFDTDSMLPVDQLSGDGTAALLGGATAPQSATAASPTDLAAIGQLQGFTFEMPPTDFNTAGEPQFDQTGMSPMMTPVMEHALPAVLGGQKVGAADDTPQTVGSDNGLPQPVDGPANEATAPATSSVMPTIATAVGTVSSATTNDDTTSNHEFQV